MRLFWQALAAVAAMWIAVPTVWAATNEEVVDAIRSAPIGAYVLAYLVVILAAIVLALSLLNRPNR